MVTQEFFPIDPKVREEFSFHETFSPDFNQKFAIRPCLKISHRDHDRAWKFDPDQPDFDWKINVGSWFYFSRQTLMLKNKSNLD